MPNLFSQEFLEKHFKIFDCYFNQKNQIIRFIIFSIEFKAARFNSFFISIFLNSFSHIFNLENYLTKYFYYFV